MKKPYTMKKAEAERRGDKIDFMHGVEDGDYVPPKSDRKKLMEKLNIKRRGKA